MNKVQITPIIVSAMVTFYKIFDDDISTLGLTNHKFRAEEAQKIALLGTAHIVRSLLMSKPQSNFFTLLRILQSLSFYILPLNNLIPDLLETWNLTLDSSLDVFSTRTISKDQTGWVHNMKAERIRVLNM